MSSKIFYIANIRLPTEKAHGIQIMKTCESLVRQGVQIELVVPRRHNTISVVPFEYYQVDKNFTITKLWCIDFLSGKFFKWFSFWLETLTFTIAARWYVRGKKVPCHTRDLLPALVLPGPIFYEIHTVPGKIAWFHRRAWQRAKGIVVISDGIKQALVGEGVDGKKILVARDAVDVHQFQIFDTPAECRTKLHLPAGQKIVVYTGHLYEWKGASTLAEAALLLSVDIHVYIVGGTTEDVEKFKQTYRSPNLHIIGWQEHRLMPYWNKAADVVVLPNSGKEKIGALYTSPLKLFEYMASGTPMVISDLPAMREVVKDDEAVFFQPDNREDLARAIRSVLEDESKYQQAAGKLRENIGQYSWEARSALMKDFIFYHHE
ncbi:MAG: glycosyltransferase family 4 protein [Candidatus Magasanikbacteria bacterium]|nr:glycosyltransferase family 4 protein [Candidatus Magasanikbacteria bacterium]